MILSRVVNTSDSLILKYQMSNVHSIPSVSLEKTLEKVFGSHCLCSLNYSSFMGRDLIVCSSCMQAYCILMSIVDFLLNLRRY